MLNEKYLFEEPEIAAIPAENRGLRVESHGSIIYGRILLPGVSDPAERVPAVLMLHGYPGIERNPDIPPALRRAGIATAEFSYRGVWGSHGEYCFSHLIEDAETMLAHLRQNAEEYRIDPERIYLVGHSMGGFTALNVLARGAKARGAVIVAPCDMGYRCQEEPERFHSMMETRKKGYFTMSDDNLLQEEMVRRAAEWRFVNLAEKLTAVPLRFIGGERDTTVPPQTHIFPVLENLRERNADVTYAELPDGHAFPSHRVTLTRMIYRYIEEMERNN